MAAKRVQEGVGFAALVVIGWSFPGVFVRWMPGLDWVQATAGRLVVALVLVLPFVLATPQGRVNLRQAAGSWRNWLLASLMTVYYTTATAAFLNAPIGEVAVLIASAPAMAVLLNRLSGHPVKSSHLVGACIGIVGAAVVALPAQFAHAKGPGNHALGVFLAVATAACAAAYSVGVAGSLKRGQHPDSLSLAVLTFALGVVALGPFATPMGAYLPYGPELLGIGLLSTAIPTISFAAASERLPRGLSTILLPVIVVSASVAAALTLGELPNWWALPGGVLVIAGVIATLRD